MKVAIYSGEIPSATFIERLITGLAKNHVEVILVGKISKPILPRKNVHIFGYKSGRFERINKLLFFLKYLVKLKLSRPSDLNKLDHWLKEKNLYTKHFRTLCYPILWHQPDVLHIQWNKAVNQFSWVQLFGMKVVVSLRGAHINYSPLSVPGLAAMYRKEFPKVDGFHGVSKAICKEATKYGASLEKCKVVYSGFPIPDFPKTDFKNDFETLAQRPVHVISVGRAHWKKGYMFALDAMSLLKVQHVPFQYTVIGAKGDEELEFQRHQLKLKEEVSFLNRVPFEKVKQMIREADILLLPSVEEGIANVVLEAMLLGTLVVTTNCGGMLESVQNGVEGKVVPVRQPQSMAEAIVQLKTAAPQNLEAMVNAAYAKVCRQHHEDKMVNDMIELYKTVLKQ